MSYFLPVQILQIESDSGTSLIIGKDSVLAYMCMRVWKGSREGQILYNSSNLYLN